MLDSRELKFNQVKTWNISHNRVQSLSRVLELLSLSPTLENIDIRKMSQIPLGHKKFDQTFDHLSFMTMT